MASLRLWRLQQPNTIRAGAYLTWVLWTHSKRIIHASESVKSEDRLNLPTSKVTSVSWKGSTTRRWGWQKCACVALSTNLTACKAFCLRKRKHSNWTQSAACSTAKIGRCPKASTSPKFSCTTLQVAWRDLSFSRTKASLSSGAPTRQVTALSFTALTSMIHWWALWATKRPQSRPSVFTNTSVLWLPLTTAQVRMETTKAQTI